MASSRRKQDEKHLKILRELVSKPANRTCFDCHQKGPTYINMTIGSFVCTTCSGILRGLNPPHRVKSISMASFTSDEVDQIKSKGNQYCQAVWLGLYNGKSNIFPDTKDEHKIRDFMINKYEKKRFYVDPVVALKNGENSQIKSESSSSASTPGSDSRSLGAITNANSFSSVSRPIANIQNAGSSPSLNGLQTQNSSLKMSSSVDLLNSLGKSTNTPSGGLLTSDKKDPFNTPVASQQLPSESFANFENANIFSTDDSFLSCPFPIPSVENISSPSELPSQLCICPDSLRSASPSNLHPDSCISQARSESPSSIPGSWDGYEEELSAAMPLIPTGELPPTYQPVHKSSSKRSLADSPVLIAAGVSAQFITPSIDIKNVVERSVPPSREGRSSSLPLSLADSQMKSRYRSGMTDFNGGSSIALTNRFEQQMPKPSSSPPQSMEDVFIRDDFDTHENPLGPAMPLLSLDPAKGERNFKGSTPSLPQSPIKFDRHLSLPAGSPDVVQKCLDTMPNEPKRNSFTSLSSKSSSFFPSPKVLRKVFSSHNITSNEGETKSEKKPLPRQLSAISQKVRARLMSDEDVRIPRSLSSSLPDCSPDDPLSERQSSESKVEPYLGNPKLENVDVSDPITIVYAKQKRAINQSLFFTNRSSSFQNLDYVITSSKDSYASSACSEESNINNLDFSIQNFSDKSTKHSESSSCGMARSKAMHGSLPSLININNTTTFSSNNAIRLTKESSGCSISMANLTSLASHFVAGASISKPTPNPYLPFSSNPLTPLSFSSSSSAKPPVSGGSNPLGSVPNVNVSSNEDRYAALKDLDEAFKCQKEVEITASSNSTMFGSPPNGTGQLQTASVFGTSPVSGGNGFYPPNVPPINQTWNATFPPVNPFSGNGSSNTNVGTTWTNGSKFVNSQGGQQQSNPFAGGADPNFNNSQFMSGFGVNNANTNSNWSNFGNTSNLQNGSNKLNTNPWGSGVTPNPFNVPPVGPPNGTSYNPFL